MKNNFKITGIVILILAIMIISKIYLSQTEKVVHEKLSFVQQTEDVVKANLTQNDSSEPEEVSGETTGVIIEKIRMHPSREFETHIFYDGTMEIAMYKSSQGKILEKSGTIPDGAIKFVNEFNDQYGVENYFNGKRHGVTKTYLPTGELYLEETYNHGYLVTSKEYNKTGVLRLEKNLEDARDVSNNNENGMGKVYWADGVLKYEWHFIKNDRLAYRKSYNTAGELISEIYYNEQGQEIAPPKTTPPVPSNLP